MRTSRRARLEIVDDGSGDPPVVLAQGGHGPEWFVEIGSLTKTVTATALDVLVRAGTIDPDAPIDAYLPVPAGTGVTASSLVTHRSGLPRLPPGLHPLTTQPYRRFDDAALAGCLSRLDELVVRPPGQTEEYSNLGYAVLGALLASATGSSWYEVVRRHVLDPAGLTDVVLEPDPARRMVRARRLAGARNPWQFAAMAPAGGLWATGSAIVRWVRVSVLDQDLGPCTAAWNRVGSLVWHNGATRDSAVMACALPETGSVAVTHTIGVGNAATDELGLALARRVHQATG